MSRNTEVNHTIKFGHAGLTPDSGIIGSLCTVLLQSHSYINLRYFSNNDNMSGSFLYVQLIVSAPLHIFCLQNITTFRSNIPNTSELFSNESFNEIYVTKITNITKYIS